MNNDGSFGNFSHLHMTYEIYIIFCLQTSYQVIIHYIFQMLWTLSTLFCVLLSISRCCGEQYRHLYFYYFFSCSDRYSLSLQQRINNCKYQRSRTKCQEFSFHGSMDLSCTFVFCLIPLQCDKISLQKRSNQNHFNCLFTLETW